METPVNPATITKKKLPDSLRKEIFENSLIGNKLTMIETMIVRLIIPVCLFGLTILILRANENFGKGNGITNYVLLVILAFAMAWITFMVLSALYYSAISFYTGVNKNKSYVLYKWLPIQKSGVQKVLNHLNVAEAQIMIKDHFIKEIDPEISIKSHNANKIKLLQDWLNKKEE